MRGQLTIRQVDPGDDTAYGAWHAAYLVSQRHGREQVATAWTAPEMRVILSTRSHSRWNAAYAGQVDGRVVCAGYLATPLTHNLDAADVGVDVRPDARRRGHGSAMLAHLEQVAREHGRTTLGAEASWPSDADPRGAGESGPDFLTARGFGLGLVEIRRRLVLPVPAQLLDELAAAAAAHHAAYTLRAWVGPVPDELLQGWAEVEASLSTEAPQGELAREPEPPDPAAVRAGEAVLAEQGRTKYNAVALDAGGQVVAYTDLATTIHEPGRGYQWGTLVRRQHRGHRLGLAVKVATLQLLQRERDDVQEVVTWNAEVNSHMIGVNQQLGYRPVERAGGFEKRLS